MNYEKAYKEALSRVRECMKDGGISQNTIDYLCNIFPELNESEDEKIRKELIQYIKNWKANIQGKAYPYLWSSDKEECDKLLAWLEKQGKQNIADKAESKFHEGDWVILTAGELSTILQIVKVATNKKLYWFDDSSYLPIVDEECLRLWTIEDAKDGDVLCVKYGNDEMPFIFTGKRDNVAYCALNSFGEFVLSIAEWLLTTSVLPATKKQRDTLFAKMHEAGYEWNADTKELKKIVTNGGDFCESENCVQKPTWSEEDERTRKEIISIVKSYRECCITEGNHRFDDCIAWLEKQGEQSQD